MIINYSLSHGTYHKQHEAIEHSIAESETYLNKGAWEDPSEELRFRPNLVTEDGCIHRKSVCSLLREQSE